MNQVLVTLEDQLIEFSAAFVKPSDDPELKPYHEYRLRGAVASKDTLFVLEKATHLEDGVATQSEEWIWWKCQYDSHRTRPLSCAVRGPLYPTLILDLVGTWSSICEYQC